MSCFDNLIGIRGYCDTEENPAVSDSGLYLQDLPMVSIKNADAAITTQASGFKLLQDKLSHAFKLVAQDAVNLMAPYFRQSSVIEQSVIGYYPDNMKTVAAEAGYLKGVEVRITEWPYLEFFLSQISLFINATGDIDLKIYDLRQNKLLDTITVAAIAGQIVTVDVNKTYATNKQALDLFIGYEGADAYQSNLNNVGSIGGCRGCGAGRSYGNQYITFYGRKVATAGNKIAANVHSVNGTSGISLTYSLNCNIEPFLCSIKNRLAMPILYRSGIEILREISVSDRLNTVVVFQKKEIEATMQYFESEYKKGMNNIFSGMRLPKDVCFHCTNTFGNAVTIP